MKQAILVVSFGTSYLDTLEKSIGALERELAAAFPERELRRAFTSSMIRRKLWTRDGIQVESVDEALERLRAEGFEDILVQPTHVINGAEYDKLRSQASPFRAVFRRFAIGAPLLTAAEDYLDLARAVASELPPMSSREALVFMGHGTGHYVNSAYAAMEYVLHDQGCKNIFVGTVEGYPTIHQVLRRLEESGEYHRVYLAPLMIVAGDHAWNDMAGEEADSWANLLLEAGYEPVPLMKGLGEYAAVRACYVRHARAALTEGNWHG